MSYIDRTREYYAAQGYEKPYRWARHTEAPFAPLAKPLAQSTVALVTTAGFADGLRIACQDRPDIFALRIALPERLYGSVIEAAERIDASGSVLTPLDVVRLREDLARARSTGARAVAIVFMHGWQFPDHESRCARIGSTSVMPRA